MRLYADEIGYRVYVTDCLQQAPQNKYLTVRYADMAGLIKKDERTGDEIAMDVISELGLKV